MSKRFTFYGPVFRFGKYLGTIKENEAIVTEAETFAKGYNNILFKVKRYFDLPKDWLVSIDKNAIEVEDKYVSDDINDIQPPPECPNCGQLLNYMGDCPVCDYGEYDLVENYMAIRMLADDSE